MAARRGKSQARRTSSNGTPGWVWLVAGAAIAAVIFLAAPSLFKKDGDDFLRAGPRANPDAIPAPVADVDAAVETTKPAAGTKHDDKPANAQTQYDFYTMLPGKEVQMSDAELAATARAEEAARARAALEGKPVPAATTSAAANVPVAPTAPTPIAESPRQPRPLVETPPVRTAPSLPAEPHTATTAAVAAPAAVPTAPPLAAVPASSTASAAASKPAATPVEGQRYILQAGSFGASGDAESTKAKLAMLGLSARVESADINGKTVYRVRMGPYGSASELAEAKQKLSSSGLSAIAIKAQ